MACYKLDLVVGRYDNADAPYTPSAKPTATPAPSLRGQRAWGRIKSTAAEQRQLWREVGEALNYGRALHPSNQAFGAWCEVEGFDMSPGARSDAMWFASYPLGNTIPAELTSPKHIRQWHRDSSAPAPLASKSVAATDIPSS